MEVIETKWRGQISILVRKCSNQKAQVDETILKRHKGLTDALETHYQTHAIYHTRVIMRTVTQYCTDLESYHANMQASSNAFLRYKGHAKYYRIFKFIRWPYMQKLRHYSLCYWYHEKSNLLPWMGFLCNTSGS